MRATHDARGFVFYKSSIVFFNELICRGLEKIFRNVVGPQNKLGDVKWPRKDRVPPIAHLTNNNLELFLAMCWETNKSKPQVLLGRKWLNLLFRFPTGQP